MQVTANCSRSKPEVEFQNSGRVYFEPGSSYISAVIWNISTKFDLLIDFDLLNSVTSTDTKPEVVFSRRGRHLEERIWRHISQLVLRFGRNSVAWCRIMCTFRASGRNRNPKIDMADIFFSKTEVVISQPSIEIFGEIWFADRLWLSEGTGINKYATGNGI